MKKNLFALCFCLLLITGCTKEETPISTETTQSEGILLIETSQGETPLPTETHRPEEPEIIRDVPYLDDENTLHTLDLYLPGEKEGLYPTLLTFHGGNGKKEDFSFWGDVFSRKGFAVISINYRQWPEYKFPKNLEDAYCALNWVVNYSDKYNLNPEEIFFLGHSAGGTLAALLGIVDDHAVIASSCPDQFLEDFQAAGIITFTVIADYQKAALLSKSMEDYVIDYLGGTYEEVPEQWIQASPASWVDGDEPPFLLIHGELDQSLPPSESKEFADIIEAADGYVELLVFPFGSHMQIRDSKESMEAVEDFIYRVISVSSE
jgi:acetyl esterase/lipase